MSIAAIESVLQQMRTTALQGGFAPRMDAGASEAVQGGGGFAGGLQPSLLRINHAQQPD